MNSVANKRITRELQLLARGSAAPGIAAWARDEGTRLDVLDAEITGASDTPYERGVFRLELHIPREYPFKPPRVRFITKIYHPNVDSDGRICLDSLNMPPKGVWKPSLNVPTILTSIQALMSTPNADDGLMADITHEYRTNPALFRRKAVQWTQLYAIPSKTSQQRTETAPPEQHTSAEHRSQPTSSPQRRDQRVPSQARTEPSTDAVAPPAPSLEPRLKKARTS